MTDLTTSPGSLPKLKSPGVLPDDSLAEAGRKVWRFLLAEMLSHEAGTRLGEDIEALHDMRVSTRRMRAAFDVFGNAFKKGSLKSHLKGLRLTGRILGRVRDLDVIIEKAGHYLTQLPETERHGLDPVLESWRSERQEARQEMLLYLESRKYLDFIEDFSNFLEQSSLQDDMYRPSESPGEIPAAYQVRCLAPVMIYARLADVRAFEDLLDTASVEQLHLLRIQFKKLRYCVEFFREVLGKESQSVIEDLKKIQDHLGDLHDAVVVCQLLQEFLKNFGEKQAQLPAYQQRDCSGVVMYLSHCYAIRQQLITNFPERWNWIKRPQFRKNLALAIAIL